MPHLKHAKYLNIYTYVYIYISLFFRIHFGSRKLKMMSPATVMAAMTPLALLTEEGKTWIQFFILLACYGAEIVCFLEAWAILTMAIFGGLLACWRHYSYKIMEALNII